MVKTIFFVHHGRMFASIDREKIIEKEFLSKVGFTKVLINNYYEYLL